MSKTPAGNLPISILIRYLENMSQLEVETFTPQTGTPVVDALRQFYAGQTVIRTPFASLVFSPAFLDRIVYDVQEGLKRATQFRTTQPKNVRGWDSTRDVVPADPEIPFPWRHLLLILLHVASLDPRSQHTPMFDPEDVRRRIMMMCHEHLFSERRKLTRQLKTKPLMRRDRYMTQLAPTTDDGDIAELGVSADMRAVRLEPLYAGNRDLGEVNVYARTSGEGTNMRAQLDAVMQRHPTIAPPGFGLGTEHALC